MASSRTRCRSLLRGEEWRGVVLAKEGFAPKLGWDTRRSPDPAPQQLVFRIFGHQRAGIVCPGCRGGMEQAGLLQGQNAGGHSCMQEAFRALALPKFSCSQKRRSHNVLKSSETAANVRVEIWVKAGDPLCVLGTAAVTPRQEKMSAGSEFEEFGFATPTRTSKNGGVVGNSSFCHVSWGPAPLASHPR